MTSNVTQYVHLEGPKVNSNGNIRGKLETQIPT